MGERQQDWFASAFTCFFQKFFCCAPLDGEAPQLRSRWPRGWFLLWGKLVAFHKITGVVVTQHEKVFLWIPIEPC